MAEPKIQRSTSPQQELPQDEKNSSFQGMKGKGEHENNILTDSDPVTEDEQPPTAATNAGESLSLPPKCMPYQRLIEKQSSTTPLSNEDITAPMLTQDAYQVNHSPYPQAANYTISDQAGINSTDQEYPTAAAQTISEAHHGNNISISIEQSVNNCLIYKYHSITESGEQRFPEELVTKMHEIIFYHYIQCLSPEQ